MRPFASPLACGVIERARMSTVTGNTLALRAKLSLLCATVLMAGVASGAFGEPMNFGRADSPAPPLPSGKLLYLSDSGNIFGFAVLDSVSRRDGKVDMYIYEILNPPSTRGSARISQGMLHMKFDCPNQVRQELNIWMYDAGGAVVVSFGPSDPEPIARGPQIDALSRYACTGEYERAGPPPLSREEANHAVDRLVAARGVR